MARPATRPGGTRRGGAPRLVAALPVATQVTDRFKEVVRSAAGMGDLAITSPRAAARSTAWYGDAAIEFSKNFRRSVFAVIIATSVYILGFGIITLGTVLANIGAAERITGGIVLIQVREPSTWVTGMIFAGIVGSAMTADLGARRVREELDALDVLGVDRLPVLVVPRIAATTLLMPVLAVIATLSSFAVAVLFAPLKHNLSVEIALDDIARTLYSLDMLVTLILKNLVLGFFVGVVSCYKGLTCRLGSEGVGRAVNQAVVITFFGVWLWNSAFNLAYLSLFPDASVFRG